MTDKLGASSVENSVLISFQKDNVADVNAACRRHSAALEKRVNVLNTRNFGLQRNVDRLTARVKETKECFVDLKKWWGDERSGLLEQIGSLRKIVNEVLQENSNHLCRIDELVKEGDERPGLLEQIGSLQKIVNEALQENSNHLCRIDVIVKENTELALCVDSHLNPTLTQILNDPERMKYLSVVEENCELQGDFDLILSQMRALQDDVDEKSAVLRSLEKALQDDGISVPVRSKKLIDSNTCEPTNDLIVAEVDEKCDDSTKDQVVAEFIEKGETSVPVG